MNDSILPLLTLSILLIVMHVWVARLKLLTKRTWLRLEQITLVSVGAGPLRAIGQARSMKAELLLPGAEAFARARWRDVVWQFPETPPIWVCRKFSGSLLSPPALGRLQHEYDGACEGWKATALRVKAARTLQPFALEPPPSTDDPVIVEAYGTAKEAVRAYQESIATLFELRKKSARSSLDLALIFIAPYTIGLGILVEYGRIAWELKNS